MHGYGAVATVRRVEEEVLAEVAQDERVTVVGSAVVGDDGIGEGGGHALGIDSASVTSLGIWCAGRARDG
jgi:hypothetical protein